MRSIFFLPLVLICALLVASIAGNAIADEIFMEEFEISDGYSTSIVEFTDNSNDYFHHTRLRVDGGNMGPNVNYTNVQGLFFAAQDIDGEGAVLPVELNITGIDISGHSSLRFSGLFAEDDSVSEAWDNSDYVHIFYQIDGGGFQNLLWIESLGTATNRAAVIDTDFDGIGDGTELTEAFSMIHAIITGTGSTLDIRVEFNLDEGDEDIAFDNFRVFTAIPEPNTALIAMLGLVMIARRRRR